MNTKHIDIGVRPTADASAETWVRQGDGSAMATPNRVDPYTARLTIDVTPLLRGRIKVAAFRQGLTVADVLRALLEREFPNVQENP
jgi:hypothetical protein